MKEGIQMKKLLNLFSLKIKEYEKVMDYYGNDWIGRK